MKKIVSFILGIVMCISIAPNAFAATVPQQGLDECTMTMEEAVECLGLTMEDVEGLQLFKMPTSQSTRASGYEDSTIPYNLNPGVYYEEVSIASFTGALHKINGPRFKWAYKIGKLNPTGSKLTMKITTWIAGQGNFSYKGDVILQQGYSIRSPIYSVTSGTEMYLKYKYTSVSTDGQPVMKSGKALVVIVVFETA